MPDTELGDHLHHQILGKAWGSFSARFGHECTIPRDALRAKNLLFLPPPGCRSYGLRMLRRLATALLVPILLCAATSCSSVKFERTSESAGTFVSTGVAFTLFSIDIPKSAINIARENASDANLSNMEVSEAVVTPHLGWFDWLLDIVGIRRARIEGTWGFRDS